MFRKDNPIEKTLDDEILNLLELMGHESKTTEEYESMTNHLTKLYELRNKSRLSKDAMAGIVANLAGLIVIMNHERAHVIASKAFSLVKKVL